MTAVEPLFHLTREPSPRLIVRYSCSCGHVTDRADLADEGGRAAYEAMRGHLVDEHPAETPGGRCGDCGAVTDYFRAHVPQLHADVWLCERHGPKIPTVVDQGR